MPSLTECTIFRVARRMTGIFLAATLALPLMAAAPATAYTEADQTAFDVRLSEINNVLKGTEKQSALEALVEQVAQLCDLEERAACLIEEAKVRIALAEAAGGITAFFESRRARARLEQAIALDPATQAGAAYAYLGRLYATVSSWPMGFGSDASARAAFAKALQYNPEGAEVNYFYGDFLLAMGEYTEAMSALHRAMASAEQGELRNAISAKISWARTRGSVH